MGSNVKKKQIDQLCELIASIDDPKEVKAFLEDLCSECEIGQMAQRVECAKLLLEGNTYNKIIAKTEISSATLSRISRCAQHGSGGYSRTLAQFFGIKTYI